MSAIANCPNCGGTHYGNVECPYLEKNMGEPCTGCGERTSYCCSDCAIDGAGKVYVCFKDACRKEYEQKHQAEQNATPVTVDFLCKALPELIDFLEMETLVYRTERKMGNAKYVANVARLLKAFLANQRGAAPVGGQQISER